MTNEPDSPSEDPAVEHLYECEECGVVWMQPAAEPRTSCPDCAADGAAFIGEYRITGGAGLYDGATSIEEMLECLERERDRLERLRLAGWTLEEPVDADTAYLFRPPSN